MDLLSQPLQMAIDKQDIGIIYAILEGIARSRVVRIEKTPDGTFIKCFTGNNHGSQTSSAATPVLSSPTSHSSSPPSSCLSATGSDHSQIARSEFLKHRILKDGPQPPHLPHTEEIFVKNTFVHRPMEVPVQDDAARSAPASIGPGTDFFNISGTQDSSTQTLCDDAEALRLIPPCRRRQFEVGQIWRVCSEHTPSYIAEGLPARPLPSRRFRIVQVGTRGEYVGLLKVRSDGGPLIGWMDLKPVDAINENWIEYESELDTF